MEKVKDLFEAQASNPIELASLYSSRVGFVIPEYQRQYDWSKENITRLFYDMLNGLQRLPFQSGASVFTFLGTLILLRERSKETGFSGESLAVVDGQQRLTTLVLLACTLLEALRRKFNDTDFSSVNKDVRDWLDGELDNRLYLLYELGVGEQRIGGMKNYPYSRIIRRGDSRGKSHMESEYRSPIGVFLNVFWKYFQEDEINFRPPAFSKNTEGRRLYENFVFIRDDLVANLNKQEWYDNTECEQFLIEHIDRSQCRSLFDRLADFYKDQSAQNRVLSKLQQVESLHDFLRLLILSSYLCKFLVFTRVITEDESAAFDIFDALNTTGQPLTALETLKPWVIAFEQKEGSYAGSRSEQAFELIAANVDRRFLRPSKKQTETKDLLVSFALYLDGRKLSKDLAAQRLFLRQSYREATSHAGKAPALYMDSLARLAQFRRFYWDEQGIHELSRFHGSNTLEDVQLLAAFLLRMRTSLVIPLLARYWSPYLEANEDARFLDVLRAIAAFIVLRRGATGGTATIDSDFRSVMAKREKGRSGKKFGLCAGVSHEEKLFSATKLKEVLRLLLKKKLKQIDKDSWIRQVVANPLYEQSQPLVRFMVLASAHHSMPSKQYAGLWDRTGVRRSTTESNFLNYKMWSGDYYRTVEHIAPASAPATGWPSTLYHDNILRHTLGNLVLLPAAENSAIGNDSWKKKKTFYLALTETDVEEHKKRIDSAEKAGYKFSNSTKKILKNGDRLELLDPLRTVEEWDETMVRRRASNIAGLCWDVVWPWLE